MTNEELIARIQHQIWKLAKRHSPGPEEQWQDGSVRTCCTHCRNVTGMHYVRWPCPDRQNIDKIQKLLAQNLEQQ